MSLRIRIYDNGGKTADRYTLVVPSVNEPGKLDFYYFNDIPYHPQGIGSFGGSDWPLSSYRVFGKLITIDDLPDMAQRFVRDTITIPLPDGYGMELPKAWEKGKRRGKSTKRKSKSPSGLRGLRR